MTQEVGAPTPSEVVRENVVRLRKAQGMSAAALARAVSDLGLPMSRDTLANIETGRRGAVTVEELFALAAALGASPLHLCTPAEGETAAPVPTTERRADQINWWLRGEHPLVLARQKHPDEDAFHALDMPWRYALWRAARMHPGARATADLAALTAELAAAEGHYLVDPRVLVVQLQRGLATSRRYVELLLEELEEKVAQRGDAQEDEA